VIGWRTARVDGRERILQLRIREPGIEPEGLYGERKVERVRVYDQTSQGVFWHLFEKGDGEGSTGYVNIANGRYSLPTIALSTFYTRRVGVLTATPALERLAETNLLHWQSQSDHRGLFRFARAGILFGSGINAEEIRGDATVGNRLWRAADPNAKLVWVEHEGRAIAASKADLDDLKADMAALSLRPILARRPGTTTATATAIDTAETNASLLTWVRRAEATLASALSDAARFAGMEDAPVTVDICDDVGLDPGEAGDIETLLKLRAMGELTSTTLLGELRRRGLFSDAFDPEVEAAELESADPMDLRSTPPAVEDEDEDDADAAA
jgi:hypothetical protein